MFKKLLKNKVRKEVKKESKKLFLYTLVGLASVLAYKKIKCKDKILNSYNDIDKEYIELKSKIDEFNSRRISDKNNNDASINEMKNIVDNTEYSKKDLDIEVILEDEFEQYQEEMDKKI